VGDETSMISDLKPYPTYKDSRLPWLEEVPEHWNLIPNRALIRKRKILVGDHQTECDLLSLTKEGVIVRDVESGKGKFSADMGTSQEVRAGDLIFCFFDIPETPRTVGLSHHNGMITGAYTVFECSDPVISTFFELFYKAMDDRKLLSPLYSGLRNTIPPTLFLGIKTPVPPHAEQATIVRFLDHMDRRIRRNILAKQKLIKLLEEYKQVIIHRAVTRGLDPTVPLKPSGVEWLGEIPEDWAFLRGKFYFQEIDKRSATGKEELLSVSHITGVTPRSQKNINMFKAESYIGYKLCNPGQIVVNTMWAWMAAIGVSRYHGIVSSSYHTYDQINKHNFHNDFLDLLLRSTLYKINYAMNSTGITSSRLRLYPEDFLNIRFLCPPMGEQEAIICWLKCMIGDLDIAKERLNGEIALLKEYRTRLISDVVTGKLDVRGIELPADEDAEVPTELSELLDDDITPDDCEIPEDEIPAEAD